MIKKSAFLITVLLAQGCTVLCPECAQVHHKLIATTLGCEAASAYEFGSIVPLIYRDECSPPEFPLDVPNLTSKVWDAIGMDEQTGYGLFDRQTLDPYYRESFEALNESLSKDER